MAKSERIALKADPSDPEDFDVTEKALEAALDERRKRGRGRPQGSTTSDREQVSLRIPGPVLAHFRAGGPGWQTRMVETLERESATGRFTKRVEKALDRASDKLNKALGGS